MKDGPTFCWHCWGSLRRDEDVLRFAIVRDQGGLEHRVHYACEEDAVLEGCTSVTDASDD